MKLLKILAAASIAVFGLTGCNLDRTAIIKVNGESITKSQYEEAYAEETKSPQYKLFGNMLKDPESIFSLMLKDRLVNELILKTIMKQEIKKRGITVTKEEIEAKKAEIIEKLGSKEKLDEILSKNKISEKKLEEDLSNELKTDKLIEQSGDVKVTEKDVKDFYTQNKQSFNYPERVRASHILIEVNPAQIRQEIISQDKKGELTSEEINKRTQSAVDAKMNFAKEIRAKAVQNPKEFASLAKQYSDDKTSAEKGGDLGFFSREAMVKPFSDAAFKLKPNTVSEIVVSDFGNHIIIVTDRAKAGIQPYDAVKDEIQEYLEQQKRVDVLKNLLDGLKASSKIEYIDSSYDLDSIQEQIKEKSKQQQEEMKAKREAKKAKKEAAKNAPAKQVKPAAPKTETAKPAADSAKEAPAETVKK